MIENISFLKDGEGTVEWSYEQKLKLYNLQFIEIMHNILENNYFSIFHVLHFLRLFTWKFLKKKNIFSKDYYA